MISKLNYNVPSKRSLVFVKEFYKKEIGMRYSILILKREIQESRERAVKNTKEGKLEAAEFWNNRVHQIRVSISILENAENKK